MNNIQKTIEEELDWVVHEIAKAHPLPESYFRRILEQYTLEILEAVKKDIYKEDTESDTESFDVLKPIDQAINKLKE